MPIRDHVVSYRNGPQVMVAGLRLQDMGYCRGAQVEITDPTGNSANMSWEFVVSNDFGLQESSPARVDSTERPNTDRGAPSHSRRGGRRSG